MKSKVLLVSSLAAAALLPFFPAQGAVLALYDFSGYASNSPAPYASVDTDVNTTAGGFSPGSGLGSNGNWNSTSNGIDTTIPAYAQKLFSSINTQALSLSNNAYVTLSVTPNSGYQMNLSSFSVDVRTTAAAANFVSYYLSSSVNGFSTPIGSVTTAQNTGGLFQTATFDLSGASYQNLASATEFRLYMWWGSSAGGSSGSSMRLDNVTLNGVAVPEPSTYALVGGGILALYFLRRRQA